MNKTLFKDPEPSEQFLSKGAGDGKTKITETRNGCTTIRGDALGKMKNGKSGEESGILPEMLKATCGEDDFKKLLLELCGDSTKSRQTGMMQC